MGLSRFLQKALSSGADNRERKALGMASSQHVQELFPVVALELREASWESILAMDNSHADNSVYPAAFD